MIVPQSRLLFWVAAVLLPLALIAGVDPNLSTVAAACVVVFAALVVVDGVIGRKSLDGIGVALPAIIRTSRDREVKFEVRLRNERQVRKVLRMAIGLPPEVRSDVEERDVVLPGGSEWSRLEWTCIPLRRGRFGISTVHVEGSSLLGFWAVRCAIPVNTELRVYPNLMLERRNLAALFLHRGAFGLHAQRQVGKGRDFEKLREYVPGDGYDEIHWKATARRRRPVTKVFQIEKTQEVYVVVDASRLSARLQRMKTDRAKPAAVRGGESDETGSETILERFVTAALVLGLAAEQQGDLFGLLTFSDKVERFVRAQNGKTHFSTCRDALYSLEPRIVSPDFDELCTFIRLRMRRRALLVFLTSLDDPALAESFVRNMDLIRRQHLVLVNVLQPAGVAPLFSGPDIHRQDEMYQRLGGHILWNRLRELEKVLQRRGVRLSMLQSERLSAETVSQYLSVKQRQLI